MEGILRTESNSLVFRNLFRTKPWRRCVHRGLDLLQVGLRSVDGSFLQVNGTAGIAVVLHDHKEAVLKATCKSYDDFTEAYEAELQAVQDGLAMATES